MRRIIKKNKPRLVVTADDLGMSPGTNEAIFDIYDKTPIPIRGSLIVTTGAPFASAMEELKSRPKMDVGVHLTLTYGKSLLGNRFYSDKHGFFRKGYIGIMLSSFFSYKFRQSVESEFRAQIEAVMKERGNITHLDTHEHIHSIPAIHRIVKKLSRKYHICEVRRFKERPLYYILNTSSYPFLFNGGLLKYMVIWWQGFFRDEKQGRVLHSVLYSGEPMSKKMYGRLLRLSREQYVEIMVHIGKTEKDKHFDFLSQNESDYHYSEKRDIEYRALMRIGDFLNLRKARQKDKRIDQNKPK